MSNETQAARQLIEAARNAGFDVAITAGVVSVGRTFTPNDKGAFAACDAEGPMLLALAPLRGGSVWGTDGGSVGGAVALAHGRYRLNKSGSGARFLRALASLLAGGAS